MWPNKSLHPTANRFRLHEILQESPRSAYCLVTPAVELYVRQKIPATSPEFDIIIAMKCQISLLAVLGCLSATLYAQSYSYEFVSTKRDGLIEIARRYEGEKIGMIQVNAAQVINVAQGVLNDPTAIEVTTTATRLVHSRDGAVASQIAYTLRFDSVEESEKVMKEILLEVKTALGLPVGSPIPKIQKGSK